MPNNRTRPTLPANARADTSSLKPINVGKAGETPWRERAFHTLPSAAEIVGLSVPSLYRLESEGRLVFKRLGGRTLVDTPSLVELIGSAEPWTPSDRGAAGRAALAESTRAAWRG